MRNLLLIALLLIGAFVLSDYFEAVQSLEAGCGCGANPNAKPGTGRNNGRKSGGTGGTCGSRPNPNQPAAEDTPKVELEWEEAQIEKDEDNDAVKKSEAKSVISQFKKALDQQKPIIVFAYVDDMDKKCDAKRKQCEKYMNDVLCDAKIGDELSSFVRVKIALSKLKDSKLRKEYKLKKAAPYISVYDFTGKQYTKTSTTDVAYIVSKLKGCVKKNEKEVKKLEKKKD